MPELSSLYDDPVRERPRFRTALPAPQVFSLYKASEAFQVAVEQHRNVHIESSGSAPPGENERDIAITLPEPSGIEEDDLSPAYESTVSRLERRAARAHGSTTDGAQACLTVCKYVPTLMPRRAGSDHFRECNKYRCRITSAGLTIRHILTDPSYGHRSHYRTRTRF
jgi:hypothetical protein